MSEEPKKESVEAKPQESAKDDEQKPLPKDDNEGFKGLPEIEHRKAFLDVFEKAPELEAIRNKMREDMIESLKSLAPMKERVKAQSFFELLASATLGTTGVPRTSTHTFEGLGEALPTYVQGVECSIRKTLVSKGANIDSTEAQHLILDWIIQPFYSKFVTLLSISIMQHVFTFFFAVCLRLATMKRRMKHCWKCT